MTMLRIVLCNCPPTASTELGRRLVDEKLAACVNILPGVRSIYRWEGNVMEESEETLLIKTMADRLDELEARIQALHPYDIPEIIAFEPNAALAEYVGWVQEQTRDENP
jgi:periplasmic divalent cation tolerance protein